VYVLVGVYALLFGGLLALATWMPMEEQDNLVQILAGTIVVMLLCGASLVVVPVRAARRRPVSRASLRLPILASGLLAGVLAFGGGIAFAEFARWETVWGIVAAAIIVWVAWGVLFSLMSVKRIPEVIGNKLHRWILAGSVLELLVAVPTHVVVRRREECCAGMATGLGICIGVAVMIVAFGPSVALLYYRRWKQIKPPIARVAKDVT
jgi:hypothetical protein